MNTLLNILSTPPLPGHLNLFSSQVGHCPLTGCHLCSVFLQKFAFLEMKLISFCCFLLSVPHIDKPTYSTRRRNQSKSRPTANSVFLRDSTDTFIFCSESLSTTSSTPSIHSETSEPMSLDLSPRDIVPQVSV